MNATQLWWYTARAGGIVAWAVVSASVVWGLLLSSKASVPGRGRRLRPNWMLDLHRFLGGTAVVFTVVHVISIIGDSYVHFGLAEVLVPLTGTWHPVAVAWGIVAFYAMVAVETTSLLRKHLSKRAWRLTHMLSFPLFAFSTIHALSAGTDRSNPLMIGSAVIVSALVIGLTTWRVLGVVHPDPPTAAHTRPAQPARQEPLTIGGRP
jgi:DMSO/TMAO reductase YedYZ heme-binding membrane subunit